jgi:dihydrofolate reductase
MRIVVTENITLDGVVSADGDWFGPFDEEDRLAVVAGHMAGESAQLYGRSTFEGFKSFWPTQPGPIAAHLNEVPKLVLSSSLSGDPGWGARVLPSLDSLPEDDGVLGATGSISVVHQLAEAGLVDEYRLWVHPVVLGSGRRLLPDGVRADLRLVSAQAFGSGVVLQTYVPAPGSE